MNNAKRQAVREMPLKKGHGDIVNRSALLSSPLGRAVMGMSVKDRLDAIAIERFFQSAGSQESVDFGRFPLHGRHAGGIMEKSHTLVDAKLGQRGFQLQAFIDRFLHETFDRNFSPGL